MPDYSALLAGGLALLVLAACFERPTPLRAGLALAAAFALAGWVQGGGELAGAALLAVLLGVNLFHLGLLLLRGRRLRFTDEETRMAAAVLPSLDRRQARHLIDQGVWIDGRAGETLTRENDPVAHLLYLADGAAEVTSGGRWIATLRAPNLIGEVTVLDESGATATVTLDAPARIWCVAAPALRRFLAENPDIRGALEHSFAGAMAGKIRATNKVLAGAG